MVKISELISYENDVFRTYAFWVAVLVVKMLGMSLLTAIQRFKNKVKLYVKEDTSLYRIFI